MASTSDPAPGPEGPGYDDEAPTPCPSPVGGRGDGERSTGRKKATFCVLLWLFPLPFSQLPIAEPRHLVGHQLLVTQAQFEQHPLVVFAPLGGSLRPRQPAVFELLLQFDQRLQLRAAPFFDPQRHFAGDTLALVLSGQQPQRLIGAVSVKQLLLQPFPLLLEASLLALPYLLFVGDLGDLCPDLGVDQIELSGQCRPLHFGMLGQELLARLGGPHLHTQAMLVIELNRLRGQRVQTRPMAGLGDPALFIDLGRSNRCRHRRLGVALVTLPVERLHTDDLKAGQGGIGLQPFTDKAGRIINPLRAGEFGVAVPLDKDMGSGAGRCAHRCQRFAVQRNEQRITDC